MPIDGSIPLGTRGVGPLVSLGDVMQRAQQAQMQRQQADALEEQRRSLAAQREQQTAAITEANADRTATGSALQAGGGVREATLAWARQNRPTIVPSLTKYFDDADSRTQAILKSRHELQTQEAELFGDLADGALQHGGTPEALRTALDYVVERFPEYKGEAEQIWGKASSMDDAGRSALLTQIRDSAPSRRPKEAAPFTLNPGDVRYGPDGKEVARNDKPAETPKAGTFEDFLTGYAQQKGRTVAQLSPGDKLRAKAQWEAAGRAPQSDNEPLVAIMGPDNQPVLVPRSQAVGKKPASTREQGRPVTSGDAGRIADLDTSLDDLGVLEQTLGTTGAGSKVGAMLPNAVTEFTGWGSDSKQRQGTIDRVKQVIGKALEGGVLRKEDEYKYEKILPTIGDPPEVAKAKLKGLKDALIKRRQTTIDALADAGYDVGKFQARTDAPTDPSGGVPPAVSSALTGQKDGRYTLSDGSVWTVQGGQIRKGS